MSRLSLGLGFAFGVAALAPAAIAPAAKAAYPERPIAVTVERIPTGYDFVFSIWNAMFVPKGTPEPILAKLEGACLETLVDAKVQDIAK